MSEFDGHGFLISISIEIQIQLPFQNEYYNCINNTIVLTIIKWLYNYIQL